MADGLEVRLGHLHIVPFLLVYELGNEFVDLDRSQTFVIHPALYMQYYVPFQQGGQR